MTSTWSSPPGSESSGARSDGRGRLPGHPVPGRTIEAVCPDLRSLAVALHLGSVADRAHREPLDRVARRVRVEIDRRGRTADTRKAVNGVATAVLVRARLDAFTGP